MISSGVKSIGYEAFAGCPKLTSVKIPKSVTEIGGYAFVETKWLKDKQSRSKSKLITVNNTLIDGSKARGAVKIPGNVKKIADSAFWPEAWKSSSVTSVTIPAGVNLLDGAPFRGCGKLKKITLKGNAPEVKGSYDALGGEFFKPCLFGDKWFHNKETAPKGLIIHVPKNATGYNKVPWKSYKIKKDGASIYGYIKYNANGGKVSAKSKKVYRGASYGKLSTPKRSGYKFLGWYTKKSRGSKVTVSTTVKAKGAHTLYARWKKIS